MVRRAPGRTPVSGAGGVDPTWPGQPRRGRCPRNGRRSTASALARLLDDAPRSGDERPVRPGPGPGRAPGGRRRRRSLLPGLVVEGVRAGAPPGPVAETVAVHRGLGVGGPASASHTVRPLPVGVVTAAVAPTGPPWSPPLPCTPRPRRREPLSPPDRRGHPHDRPALVRVARPPLCQLARRSRHRRPAPPGTVRRGRVPWRGVAERRRLPVRPGPTAGRSGVRT